MLNLGELFPETAGFITVIQGQVIDIHNYKKCILGTNNNNNNLIIIITKPAENADRKRKQAYI